MITTTSDAPSPVWGATRLNFCRYEAARLLGISARQLDYAISNGRLDVRKVGRRVLIPRAELERFGRIDHPSFQTPA